MIDVTLLLKCSTHDSSNESTTLAFVVCLVHPHDVQSSISLVEATEFSAACTQQSAYYAGRKTACQGLTRGKCLGYSED